MTKVDEAVPPEVNLPEQADLNAQIDTTQPQEGSVWLQDLWLPDSQEPLGDNPTPLGIPDLNSQRLLLGLDTVDVSTLRGLRFDWLAGYVGGFWPTFHPMVLAYPELAAAGRIKSYAVNFSEDADWLDCESGNASVAQADPWVNRQFARGHEKPGVYANANRWYNEGLLDALSHWGSRITRIVAHYTGIAVISHAGFDCQQYTDRYAGRNIDGNVAVASMFDRVGPPVVNTLHYEWFYTGPFPTRRWGALDERLVVEEYDGARKHPRQYKAYITNVLEPKLKWLADRVANVAIYTNPHSSNNPSWDVDNRGWRFQQLIHRSHGMQFAK